MMTGGGKVVMVWDTSTVDVCTLVSVTACKSVIQNTQISISTKYSKQFDYYDNNKSFIHTVPFFTFGCLQRVTEKTALKDTPIVYNCLWWK